MRQGVNVGAADLSFSSRARAAHMCLPAPLESDQVVACALSVLKGLAQFVQGAEAEVKVCDHLRISWVRLVQVAWFGGH